MNKKASICCAAGFYAVAGFTVPAAYADVSASVGAANMYYWRGLDLGGGAAISADINYSDAGFKVGAWTSSGDEVLGTEYDLYAEYSITFSELVAVTLGYVSYSYADIDVAPGDYAELYGSITVGPVKLMYYDNVANTGYITSAIDDAGNALAVVNPVGYDEYTYITAELAIAKFALKYGIHEDDLAHVDLTYKYNDKLSFLVGKVVDDSDGVYNDGAKLVASLVWPIE